MAILRRQRPQCPLHALSVRLEKPKYDVLTEFAYKKRFTISVAVSLLLGKALAAERGEPYVPYISD